MNRILHFKNPCISTVTFFILTLFCGSQETSFPIIHAQGEMAGEVTQNSVILQSRLTSGNRLVDGDLSGSPGFSCFEIAISVDFKQSFKTVWIQAVQENDFIIKTKVTKLKSETRYYYRLLYGPDTTSYTKGNTCTFRTWSEKTVKEEVSFVVVTGMCYSKFYFGIEGTGKRVYTGKDKNLGYPALETILNMKPDFFVGTGDNVYYDYPKKNKARTQSELRKKWHQQFCQPRFIKLLSQIPTYWEKDDHDYRYNDCDTTGSKDPSHRLGIKTFQEQVPVVDPTEAEPITYRTYQINRLLQIWLVEGRDYRSPNKMPDGPEKTLWGKEQKEWLQNTLLKSNAIFKILISPTPMIGPDIASKIDNHTNINGFRYEGEAFFNWLKKNDFLQKNFYIICGDRHWQYHSIHPLGFEEYSCGALVDANSRLGKSPGDPTSTDPEGKVTQLYTQEEGSGGFLKVNIIPEYNGEKPAVKFAFYDEKGVLLYATTKVAK